MSDKHERLASMEPWEPSKVLCMNAQEIKAAPKHEQNQLVSWVFASVLAVDDAIHNMLGDL